MATSGWAHSSWKVNGAVGKQSYGPGDEAAGVSLALGVLAALYHRNQTGKGQKLEVSMQEALMGFMIQSFHEHFEGMGPSGAYTEVKDGYVAAHVPDLSDELFIRYATSLSHPEALSDPRFANKAVRRENLKLLQQTVGEWMKDFTTLEIFEILRAQNLAVGPVMTLDQVMDDQHIKAREAFVKVDHPQAGELTLLAPWIRFSDTPSTIRHTDSAIGEHNYAVYEDMFGYDRAKVDQLIQDGAI